MVTHREGLAEQNTAAEIKVRAERKLGEMLPDTVRRGRPEKGNTVLPFSLPAGIGKMESSRYQLEYKLPEELFVAFVA